MKKKRKIFMSSLVTVIAAGAIGVNMAQASYMGVKNTKYGNVRSEMVAQKYCTIQQSIATRDAQDRECNVVLYPQRDRRTVLKNAVDTYDWLAYRSASKGTRKVAVIDTAEKFAQLIEARDLHRQGRHEEAREITQKLGIHDRKMWQKMVG
jgi:hypothetical protein